MNQVQLVNLRAPILVAWRGTGAKNFRAVVAKLIREDATRATYRVTKGYYADSANGVSVSGGDVPIVIISKDAIASTQELDESVTA